MNTRGIKLSAATLFAPVALVGCVNQEPPTSQTEAEEIIGGFPASSPVLDVVGAFAIPASALFEDGDSGAVPASALEERSYLTELGLEDSEVREDEQYLTFCTGTLIEPDVVLTAQHCVDDLSGDEEFALGYDGTQPDDTVAIEGVLLEDSVEGGAIGLGSDTALVYLESEVEHVEPAGYGPLNDDDVGQDYVGVGYGVQNNDEESGTRKLGAMTLRGVGGNMADNLFGDFEGFLDHVDDLEAQADPEELYQALELIDEYEATFGHAPGNAQSCFGDSGGPVLHHDGEELVVRGWTSWGLGTEELICDWGGVYGVVGPTVEDFIERGVACPMVPADGMCDGDQATFCEGNSEDGFETVEEDCAEQGLVCGEDDDGQAACIDDTCDGVPEDGMCDGDTVVRCTADNEGDRRVVETDCSVLGMTCGEDGGEKTCVE